MRVADQLQRTRPCAARSNRHGLPRHGDRLGGRRHDGPGRLLVPSSWRLRAVRRRTARHDAGFRLSCRKSSPALVGRSSAVRAWSCSYSCGGRSRPLGGRMGPLPAARADEDRTIVQQVAVARWSRTLPPCGASMPLLQALEITGRTDDNVAVEEAMDSVISSVKRGGTITAPLAQAPIFPSMVTAFVGVGEETGALDQMISACLRGQFPSEAVVACRPSSAPTDTANCPLTEGRGLAWRTSPVAAPARLATTPPMTCAARRARTSRCSGATSSPAAPPVRAPRRSPTARPATILTSAPATSTTMGAAACYAATTPCAEIRRRIRLLLPVSVRIG